MIQAGTISTGLAWTDGRLRRILDQFDQPVAVDDLAGGDGNVAAGHESFRAGGLLPGIVRCQSSRKLCQPRIRFAPP